MAHDQHVPRKRWITAGAVIVAMAAVLVALAIYFAASKSQAFALLRIADAQRDARRLRAVAAGKIGDESRILLAKGVAHFRKGQRHDPFAGRRDARWLGDVFIWDGGSLAQWIASDESGGMPGVDPALSALITSRLRFRLSNAQPRDDGASLPFLTDVFGGEAVVLSYFVDGAGTGSPILAAVRIDLEHLRRDYLEPFFSAEGKLAIRHPADVGKVYWSEPFSGALPLVIVPAAEFVESELGAVPVEVGVYVGIGLTFLLVLTVLVWKLVRLVQREVALSKLKSNFVADVSHELKTPLALIRMFAEMLTEDRVPSEEKKQEYYEVIARESTRLTRLIDNILDFSRIDAGHKVYTMETVDVGQIVGVTYDSYAVDFDRRGFEHSLTIEDGLPTIHADPDAIAQAVVNLMSNAVKYSADDKRIEITVARETRRDRHGVLISLTDCGIGMSAEDRAHLFDGFFRAEDDRVRRVHGTGLGLSVVRHIVEAHGGSIDVESRLVKGSVFRIFLPESAATADGDGKT